MVRAPGSRLVWLTRVLDIAVIVAFMTVLATKARRQDVVCEWAGTRASCECMTIDAIGFRHVTLIQGIQGPAFRDGHQVGLVTSARNKDTEALFGTRLIETWDDASAQTIERFADRPGDRIRLTNGPESPHVITIGLSVLLFSYSWLTRSRTKETA